MSPAVTALSAPGKVLLTGGYLVLDRNYTGTVFALDARIHVVVQQLRRGHRRGTSGSTTDPKPTGLASEVQSHTTGAVEDQDAEDTVVVRSPQFVDAVWEYGVQRCDNGGGVKVVQKGTGYAIVKRQVIPQDQHADNIRPTVLGTPSSRPPSAMP